MLRGRVFLARYPFDPLGHHFGTGEPNSTRAKVTPCR